MAKKEYLHRYILIVELLRRKSVSFLEIQEYLFDNEIDISQRTFQRDKEEIESLWGIEIKFNKKDGNYEIKEELSDGKFDRIAINYEIVYVQSMVNVSVADFVVFKATLDMSAPLFAVPVPPANKPASRIVPVNSVAFKNPVI